MKYSGKAENRELLFDLSVMSGCYYAPPGHYYGLGRVTAGLSLQLAKIFPERLGLCSSYNSVEASLYLAREFPGLVGFCVEEEAIIFEKQLVNWVDLGDPKGGIRQDRYSKARRALWRIYNDNLRWRIHNQTAKFYRGAKLVHSELGVDIHRRSPNAQRVYTVHDLMSISDPNIPKDVRDANIRFIREAWSAGAYFCCVSQFTADSLMELLSAGSDRIRAISLGVDPALRPVSDPQALERWRQKLGLEQEQRYVIAQTGQIERKNLVGAIRTIDLVRKAGHSDLMLVFAGYEKDLLREFAERVPDQVPWRSFVKFTGGLEDADFPILYSGAELMLFLSWAEGFGLPPLEAMACGAPVVCTNRTSVPEVVGDAALVVDPANLDEVSEAVLKVLENHKIREGLISAGLARSMEFQWDKVGSNLASVWRDALNE